MTVPQRPLCEQLTSQLRTNLESKKEGGLLGRGRVNNAYTVDLGPGLARLWPQEERTGAGEREGRGGGMESEGSGGRGGGRHPEGGRGRGWPQDRGKGHWKEGSGD